MTAPTFFRYADRRRQGGHGDSARVGCWLADGTAHDVCDALHGDVPPHDSDGCLIAAVLEHAAVLDQLAGSPAPIRPERIRPVIGRPRNVFGAPINYLEHGGELGARSPSPSGSTTRDLGLFVKAGGSISGASDPIELPDRPEREFQYEGEIAVVIGRPGFDVPAGDALSLVAGFTGALDVTMRLEADKREERSMRKSFRTFTPVGPAVLPFTDPDQATGLALTLTLNGEVRQRGRLDQLIVGVADLIAMASSVVPLEPGDLILTGTPSGVGALAKGDVVELAVTGLPPLRLDVTVRGGHG
jgi:2-keto-4-pentenoate hydratase/2-oxohepta-3-ene-1,7-dioic acid hydratase in catechol pathway